MRIVSFLKTRALLVVLAPLIAFARVSAADDAPLLRVFLNDGSALVSYGEFARVGDRVVFSMPLGSVADNPTLHVVDIAASRVDWARTNRYAESARTTRYFESQAERDYAALSNDVARNIVARWTKPARDENDFPTRK